MYKVEIKFVTDGDFSWKFLPVDFDVYCEGEEYCFYGTFESYNSLLTWANENLPFLIEHVIGNYKTEDVKKSLTKFHNNIKENKLPIYESWDGNYDGTLIMCRKELPSIQINVAVTNEFYKRFYACDYISISDIRTALEKLVEEKEQIRKSRGQ